MRKTQGPRMSRRARRIRCDHAPAWPCLPCRPCDVRHVTQDGRPPKRRAATKALKAHARVNLQVTQREANAVDGLAHLGLRIGMPMAAARPL